MAIELLCPRRWVCSDSKAIVMPGGRGTAPQESRITKITESEAWISAYGQVTSVLEGVRQLEALNDVNDLLRFPPAHSSKLLRVRGCRSRAWAIRSHS